MSLQVLLESLEASWASVAIRESILFYPLVETTHVLTLCLFLGMTSAWDLRLAGCALRSVPVSQVVNRLFPCFCLDRCARRRTSSSRSRW